MSFLARVAFDIAIIAAFTAALWVWNYGFEVPRLFNLGSVKCVRI